MRSHRTPLRARLVAAVLAATALLATGCSGGGGSQDGGTPEEVLAEAKQHLDATTGVRLSLSTEQLPDGVDGILEATGVGTHAPAFEGELTVRVSNLTVEVPVVAVDGLVFAEVPFTTGFSEIDPAEYGAPDPAELMDPDTGISSWLVEVEEPAAGEEVRDGDQVLTAYTGVLPGDAVASVIPSADQAAEFDATFLVNEEGLLSSAEVAGPFYGGEDVVDYTITVSEYGTEPDITRP